jgi:hypothetical protein
VGVLAQPALLRIGDRGLAEMLGSAVALNFLSHIPTLWAVIVARIFRTLSVPSKVGFPMRIPARFVGFRLPKTRFRGNVWESGTQNACRKTCEFPGRAEASLIGRFSPFAEKV